MARFSFGAAPSRSRETGDRGTASQHWRSIPKTCALKEGNHCWGKIPTVLVGLVWSLCCPVRGLDGRVPSLKVLVSRHSWIIARPRFKSPRRKGARYHGTARFKPVLSAGATADPRHCRRPRRTRRKRQREGERGRHRERSITGKCNIITADYWRGVHAAASSKVGQEGSSAREAQSPDI